MATELAMRCGGGPAVSMATPDGLVGEYIQADAGEEADYDPGSAGQAVTYDQAKKEGTGGLIYFMASPAGDTAFYQPAQKKIKPHSCSRPA